MRGPLHPWDAQDWFLQWGQLEIPCVPVRGLGQRRKEVDGCLCEPVRASGAVAMPGCATVMPSRTGGHPAGQDAALCATQCFKGLGRAAVRQADELACN